MDSQKVAVKKAKYGKGVFAKEKIKKGELVASFDGRIYSWRSKLWTQDLYDHAIQFEEKRWRDSNGIARLINHSCDANCGIKNLFDIVALREIKVGEEITWDYEMTEDHPWWRMKCKCKSKDCRVEIGAHKNMPLKTRKKYKGYISKWLVDKYK